MQVEFKIQHAETKMGETLCLVGDRATGTNWNAKTALEFKTTAMLYPEWHAVRRVFVQSKQDA